MIIPRKIAIPVFIAIIALSGFVVYLNSLPGPFLWDDDYLVADNSYLDSWENVPKVLFGDIGSGSHQNYGFYRPLQILSYLVTIPCGVFVRRAIILRISCCI